MNAKLCRSCQLRLKKCVEVSQPDEKTGAQRTVRAVAWLSATVIPTVPVPPPPAPVEASRHASRMLIANTHGPLHADPMPTPMPVPHQRRQHLRVNQHLRTTGVSWRKSAGVHFSSMEKMWHTTLVARHLAATATAFPTVTCHATLTTNSWAPCGNTAARGFGHSEDVHYVTVAMFSPFLYYSKPLASSHVAHGCKGASLIVHSHACGLVEDAVAFML